MKKVFSNEKKMAEEKKIWLHLNILIEWFPPGVGGGGTPYNGLYGEASPERGTFFRLQVYKRVGKLVI